MSIGLSKAQIINMLSEVEKDDFESLIEKIAEVITKNNRKIEQNTLDESQLKNVLYKKGIY